MTLSEWLDVLPPRAATYKDCKIDDFTVISERYVLLTLKLPSPTGGTVDEIVSMDASIETQSE